MPSKSAVRRWLGTLPRLALFAAGTAALVVSAAAAAAQDGAAGNVFTIGRYPIDAVAENAVAAKERAVQEGQAAALKSLFKRLVPVTRYGQLNQVTMPQAADLVESVQMRSEQNSAVEYVAEMDITFSADGVRRALMQAGLPFVEEPAPVTTVIPIYRAPAEGAGSVPAAMRQEAGARLWRDVWAGLDLKNALAPVRLAALRREIHPDTIQMVVSGDGGGDRILSGEYGTDRVVLVIAQPDTASGRVAVTVAGRDGAGRIALSRAFRFAANEFDYAMELAAVVVHGVLEGRWKVIKAPASAQPVGPTASSFFAGPSPAAGTPGSDRIPARVLFSSMGDWQRLRTAVEGVAGAGGVEVVALTPRSADVVINYRAGADALASALLTQGVRLDRSQSGWLIR